MGTKVLVTGGTGLVGRALIPKLLRIGYDVRILSRTDDSTSEISTFTWNPAEGLMDPNALVDLDYIIHLAGANVGEQRWTSERKQEILDSRINSTRLLFEMVKAEGIELKGFISSSAIGFYGNDTGDSWVDETSPLGEGFLADVTNQWENEALRFKELGTRTVCLRTGVVLSTSGGALAKMSLPVKFAAGAPLGSGKQYISWVHLDDLCEAYILALENDTWSDVFNVAAPNPVTNKEFTKELGQVLHRPIWLPNVPSFSLKMMLGEMASIVLGGNRVSSKKATEAGLIFQYQDLRVALEDLLS